ncbi:ExbD/TolR family protein [Ideonella oryzae]|uniref:Biopolymer transporter ExbD n=1 Tax=Ideonella oryzae TaxID=2937441 RepID=A0ABT1BTN2_9BURK|nr:biopolymer transporter ExbD [Ideonella oryzae]MCO5979199.1 biopolymer transporter ExbD [Ideonella oryzae]
MNFRGSSSDEPEINLIPFIDVLLVILIFLMLSTTYAKFTELQVNLPSAAADPVKERPAQIIVAVAADGRYAVDGQPVDGRDVDALASSLQKAAGGQDHAFLIISADATAAHQSVINVLDAARRVGLNRITFAAQLPAQGSTAQP